MSNHHKINYVEFPSTDLLATKAFFTQVFDWRFTDYGTEYTAIEEGGLDGGFFQSDQSALTENGSVLVVLYSSDLDQTLQAVTGAGATINKPIFSFPGGERFHFIEPGGNELAVWSDKNIQQD